MLYEKYQKKVWKTVKVLSTLRRFRVLIICVLLAITALVACFLATKGIVYGEELIPATIEYGVVPVYTAKGFFSDTVIEYSTDQVQWDSAAPVQPGQYFVRARSNGSFGERYGDVHTFEIIPRKIQVYVKENTIVYGATPSVTSDSVGYADTIRCDGYTFTDITQVTTQVIPNQGEIRLYDSAGLDVTNFYTIQPVSRNITFAKREVTIQTWSDTVVYDGKVHAMPGYQLLDDSALVPGDEMIVVFGGQSEVGTMLNDPRPVIRNEFGDVTHHYTFHQSQYGTIEVTKRPLLVSTEGGNFTYDGTAHSNENYTVDDAFPLLEGHTIVPISFGSITNVGDRLNTFLFDIVNGEGKSVKDQYYRIELSDDDCGVLKVVPREVTVTTDSATQVYNGQELTSGGYKVEAATADSDTGLITGHNFIASVIGKQLLYGSSPNSIDEDEIEVTAEDGADVKHNYKVIYRYGSLKVTKRAVTVTADSVTKVYDGNAMRQETATASDVGENSGLLPGHRVIITTTAESVIEAFGSVDNEIATVQINDENNKDVTTCYAVAEAKGVLTVTKRPVLVTADSGTWTYADMDFTLGTVTGEALDVTAETGLLTGHTVTATVTGSIREFGTVENVIVEDTVNIQFGDKDVTGNYQIETAKGTLTVLRRVVTVTADSAEHTYDDTAFSCDTFTYDSESGDTGVIEGHQVFADVVGSITNAGTQVNAVTKESVQIFAPGGEVTDNYDVQTADGTLTVHKRKITLTAGDVTKTYNDQYETNGVISHVFNMVEGHRASADILGRERNATQNSKTYIDLETLTLTADNGTRDVKDNYDWTCVDGALIIETREIILSAGDVSKVYDDLFETEGTLAYTENVLAEHTVFAEILGDTRTVTSNGTTYINEETISITANGTRDVTGNYTWSCREGSLEITKREIVLTAGDVMKVYDDLYETNGVIAKTENMVTGHMVHAEILGDERDVVFGGTTYISAPTLTITADGGTRDVKDNYTYSLIGGRLDISPREITLTADDITKVYDDLYTTDGGIKLAENMVTGHRAVAAVLGDSRDVTASGKTYINAETLSITADGGTRNVIGNYDWTLRDGSLAITTREIILTAGDVSKVYDDRYTTDGIISVADNLVVGHDVCAAILGNERNVTLDGITYIDESTLTITADGGTRGVKGNYTWTCLEGDLEITKRAITITAGDVTKVYDDLYTTDGVIGSVDNIVAGHVVTSEILGRERDATATGSTYVNLATMTIFADNGVRDVKDNYEWTCLDGALVINRRHIVLTIGSGSKIYDGTVLDGNLLPDGVYTYDHAVHGSDEGILLDLGHAIVSLTVNGAVINTWDDGTNDISEIVISVEEVSDGETVSRIVTGNYDVETIKGTLTIQPRPIRITAATTSKIYDGLALVGAELTGGGYTYEEMSTDRGLVTGEDILVEVIGSVTDVVLGIKDNCTIGEVTILSALGNVTNNYTIERIAGTLSIDKRNIYITVAGGEKVYDGTVAIDGEYTVSATDDISGLVLSHRVEANTVCTTAFVTIDGFVTLDKETFDILNELGDSVKDNYSWKITDGALTITKRPVTIDIPEGTKAEYTGDESTTCEIKVTNTAGGENEGLLAENIATAMVTIWGREFGVWDATIDKESVRIYARMEGTITDVTGNYEIYVTPGTAEIVKRVLTIYTGYAEKYYDGIPLIRHEYDASDTLFPGHSIYEVIFTGSQTEVGSSPNTVSSVVIHDENGVELKDFYEIVVECGDLIVNEVPPPDERIPLNVTVFTLTRNYTGTAHSYAQFAHLPVKLWNCAELPEGVASLDIQLVGELTNVGELTLEAIAAMSTFTALDAEGNDISAMYYLNLDSNLIGKDGVTKIGIRVNPRNIELQVASTEKEYDGEELTCHEYSFSTGTLLAGHKIVNENLVFIGTITEVGSIENTIDSDSIRVVDAEGHNVTQNYTFTVVPGILTVTEA